MLKKNTLIVALIAALPLSAQEQPPQAPQPQPARHWGARGEMPAPRKDRADMHKRMMEQFDTDKDGQLSEAEKEAMKAEFAKRRAEKGARPSRPEGKEHPGNRRRPHSERPEMIEKFDADKDGQLSPEEHAALRAEVEKARERSRERVEKFHKEFMEKFDTDKDGKLSDAEKEAARAARSVRRLQRPAHGNRPKRKHHGRPAPQAEGTPATLEL
ncbi:MAG: hypothetical protein IJ943_03845 [Akkermansia sp.]|nr:hypothetical protein [Akkermansia sp.]